MKTKTESYGLKEHGLASKAVVLGTLALFFGVALSSGVAIGSGFNLVQVFAATSANLPYSYTFTAYNTTGSMVASYQTSLSAAAFELPSGQYLFTVSAVHWNYSPCYDICPLQATATPGSGPTAAPSSGSTSAPAILVRAPSSEYGFVLASVTSAQTLNINLVNVTKFPTSTITVKASYVNGTAAAGASVSASVVGQFYYWWGQGSNLNMSGQTNSDGVANLVVPRAPVVVTAWKWLPVTLPASNQSVTTNIGGEPISIIVHWLPTYVGLSASGVLVPPDDTISLTLKYQQPSYWVAPAGVEFAGAQGTSGAALSNQPTATPALAAQPSQSSSSQQSPQEYYLPSQIPQLQSGSTAGLTTSGYPLSYLAITGVVAALAGVGLAALFLRRRSPPMAKVP